MFDRRNPDEQNCPARLLHRVGPRDYGEWKQWAKEMRKTHVQRQCYECGLWVIWKPKNQPSKLGLKVKSTVQPKSQKQSP